MPTNPAIPAPISTSDRIADRLAQLERRLSALEGREGVPVVSALPAAGKAGRVVMLGGVLYADNGSSWTAV